MVKQHCSTTNNLPSTFGSFSPEAHSLLRALSHRSGSSVPPSLVEEASWAAPRFAPFARQALSLTVRRSLASVISAGWWGLPRGGRGAPSRACPGSA